MQGFIKIELKFIVQLLLCIRITVEYVYRESRYGLTHNLIVHQDIIKISSLHLKKNGYARINLRKVDAKFWTPCTRLTNIESIMVKLKNTYNLALNIASFVSKMAIAGNLRYNEAKLKIFKKI